mmetsp:Transcript_31031/g.63075  ORF Transcript_31031/g.63075 Transcript_31031/m.63075 type:complete len:123 (-) Transcript_31031:38-406(-)
MTESPLQITPSQSKMKTSTLGSKSFAGSVNFNTFAFSAVPPLTFLQDDDTVEAARRVHAVLTLERPREAMERAAREAEGVNAVVDEALMRPTRVVRADLERFMVRCMDVAELSIKGVVCPLP